MTFYHMPYVEVFRGDDGEWYWRCRAPGGTWRKTTGPFANKYTALDDAKQSNILAEDR